MTIEQGIILLTYLLLLVLSYQIIFLINKKEDNKRFLIISTSYKHAYTILFFGILIVYTLIKHPSVHLESQTISYLILASKYLSVITLAGSIFLLSKK
ncbi:hypothetical protein [Neobacillus sp. DY30]|uniref:hypothetical protein n=1 Tax=Neobacillus sp. DY30 TaxID=3047871 RepID=UPI0024BFA982|nr:hypothetical protein [Neobacillus sp. DY30]WHY02878.1 hypothetical protein QNH29_11955 [Neobacillus sp. DY30]